MKILSRESSPASLRDRECLFGGVLGLCWVIVFWLIWATAVLYRGGYIYLGWSLLAIYALTLVSLIMVLWRGLVVSSGAFVGYLSLSFIPWLASLLWSLVSRSEAYWYAQGEFMIYASAVMVFFMASNLDDRSVRLVFRVIIGACLACVLVGLVQKTINYSWHPLGGIGTIKHGGRLTGVFGQPNSFACFMNMVLAYPLLKMLRREKWFTLYGLLAFLGMWCVHDSGSRAGGITLVVVILTVSYFSAVVWRERLTGLATMVLMFFLSYWLVLLFGGVIDERISVVGSGMSSYGRITYYAGASAIFSEYPVFGAGLANYHMLWDRYFQTAWHSHELHAHSTYLEVLCETGVVGFGLLFGPIALIVYRVAKKRLWEERARSVDLIVYSSMIGFLAFGIHEFVNFEVKVASIVWLAAVFLGVMARDVSFPWSSIKSLILTLAGVSLVLWVPTFMYAQSYYYSSIADTKLRRAVSFMGLGLLPKDQLEEAEDLYQKGIDVDPRNLMAIWGRARSASMLVFASGGEDVEALKESIAYYDQCIAMSPQEWMLYLEKGKVLGMDANYQRESEMELKKAVSIAPKNLYVQLQVGEVLKLHGREIEASRALRKVVEQAPEFTDVYKDALEILNELKVEQLENDKSSLEVE